MDRIQELAELIRYHSELYYSGKPELSDAEFDSLIEEMKALDPQNVVLLEVGAKLAKSEDGGFKKVKHASVMGSLDKSKSIPEIQAWYDSNAQGKSVILTPKIDGCFTADAKVMLPNGEERDIARIKKGDCVFSFNEKTGQFEPKVVTGVLVRPKDNQEWILLKLDNGRQVRCTANHQFLTKNRGWVEAGDLTGDDDIMEASL